MVGSVDDRLRVGWGVEREYENGRLDFEHVVEVSPVVALIESMSGEAQEQHKHWHITHLAPRGGPGGVSTPAPL